MKGTLLIFIAQHSAFYGLAPFGARSSVDKFIAKFGSRLYTSRAKL